MIVELQMARVSGRSAQQLRVHSEASTSGNAANGEDEGPPADALAAKFGSSFASVLQGALQRAGNDKALFNADTLSGSGEREPEPP